jgi:hypothetical protein
VPLSPAERSRRYRLRKRGIPIPKGRPGRRSNEDYFEAHKPPPPSLPTGYFAPSQEAIDAVARLLDQARLQSWDGTIAAGGADLDESETVQFMRQLLAMCEPPEAPRASSLRSASAEIRGIPPELCSYCSRPTTRMAGDRPLHLACERQARGEAE